MTCGPHAPTDLQWVSESPVGGLALAERRVANPDATIICVHGGLDRGGSFARLARRTDAFDLVTYDRRGYQASRGLEPINLELHVDDLLTLAAVEAQRGPVIFFGHSFGGVVALSAAVSSPGTPSLVVVYEAPMPWVLTRPSSRPVPGDDPRVVAEQFFRRMVSKDAWDRLSEAERESRRLDGPALLSDLRRLRLGIPFDLAQLPTPTVYAHGDWLLAPYYRQLCKKLIKLNPLVTSHELSDAGHGAHLSNPDQLAALFRDLWKSQCASV